MIIGAMNGNKLLQRYIKEQGLTICEAAKKAGLSQSLVSMHLSDGAHKRGIGSKSAVAYSKAFGLPLDELLSTQEDEVIG